MSDGNHDDDECDKDDKVTGNDDNDNYCNDDNEVDNAHQPQERDE